MGTFAKACPDHAPSLAVLLTQVSNDKNSHRELCYSGYSGSTDYAPGMDPIVGAAVTETTKAGGGVLSRLLGPTADEMGIQLQQWYRRTNVERVARRAEAKAGTHTPGSIPPRVAAEVFEKAQWADDEFVSEYLSGVLASARTPDGTDDSAVSWTAMVGRLSSDQLRTHHLLYCSLRSMLVGSTYENSSDWEQKRVMVSFDALVPSFDWPVAAREFDTNRLIDAFYGLEREALIGDVGHGSRSFFEKHWQPASRRQLPPGAGFFIFHATTAGTMLFLRAHGHRAAATSKYLSPSESFLVVGEEAGEIPIPEVHLADDLPLLPAE